MKKIAEFPFARARKIRPDELKTFRKAYQNSFGEKPPRRGRPPKGADKYKGVYIRLHPKALRWALAQAALKGIGYQTVINESLLRLAA
jgi:hypothetical protein